MARKSANPVKKVGFKLVSADDVREGSVNKYYARFRSESDIGAYVDSDYIAQFQNLNADTLSGDSGGNIRIEIYDSTGSSLR
jgi:hypothetical protein